MKKTAILIGATGLTGGYLLDNLIADSNFEKIIIFTRRSVEKTSLKIEEHIVDLLELDNYKDLFKGDVVFCCIGTTKKKTPDDEAYRDVDYGIPVAAAKLAKRNRIDTFMVISALGADYQSKVFYNRLKGEMERDVLKEHIQNIYILRPSLIVGDRNEKRFGEDIASFFMKTFNFLIPRKYKSIEAKTIAKTMQTVALHGYTEVAISSEEIREIAS